MYAKINKKVAAVPAGVDRHRISIITPVFNGAPYLQACVENVLSQQITNLEHLIIDGGSKDGTAEQLTILARQFPHIRFVSEPDKGQSDAMNKGIKLASGAIVSFLNVDDFYQSGAVTEGIKFLAEHPRVDMVVGDCRIINEHGDEISINQPSDLRLESLLLGWEFTQYPANPSAYFYRKQVHQIVGEYDTGDHYAMDLSFILACAAKIKIAYIPRLWGNFRLMPGTKTYNDAEKAPARVLEIRNNWIGKLSPVQRLRMEFIKLQKRASRRAQYLRDKHARRQSS